MRVDGSHSQELVADGVCVHFDGVRAVDGLDLALERGEILGVIGPNGAGKTTLMSAMTGFARLTAGTVRIGHSDITGLPPERIAAHGLVRTFQEVATFPELTVFENVELGALGGGLSRGRARERTRALLEELGLAQLSHLRASALPHGEERRVGIARAAAVAPAFLLLDEPAAGLDDDESLALVATIRQLRDRLGSGVLLVEHDMRVIFGACDRIQVLDQGKTIAVGSRDEIACDEAVIVAYLGERGARDARGG